MGSVELHDQIARLEERIERLEEGRFSKLITHHLEILDEEDRPRLEALEDDGVLAFIMRDEAGKKRLSLEVGWDGLSRLSNLYPDGTIGLALAITTNRAANLMAFDESGAIRAGIGCDAGRSLMALYDGSESLRLLAEVGEGGAGIQVSDEEEQLIATVPG